MRQTCDPASISAAAAAAADVAQPTAVVAVVPGPGGGVSGGGGSILNQTRRKSSLITSYGSMNDTDSVQIDVEKQLPPSAPSCRVTLNSAVKAVMPIASSALPASPADTPDLMTRVLQRLRHIPCAGLVLAMLSGIFFATAGFIVKMIPDVNPIQIVISRSVSLIEKTNASKKALTFALLYLLIAPTAQ